MQTLPARVAGTVVTAASLWPKSPESIHVSIIAKR